MPARLLHDEHLVGADGTALRRSRPSWPPDLPVLVVPGLLVADNALLDWLRAYAAAGGHLVLGPRTAYGDEEGRARTEVKPARLADAAGVRYQEFSNLNDPLPLVAASDGVHPVRRRGDRDPLGRRADRRGRRGAGRLPAPALRSVPRRRQPAPTARAGSPPSAPCRTRPSAPTWPAGWRPTRAGRACPTRSPSARPRTARDGGCTWCTTGAGTGVEVSLPRPLTDLLTEEARPGQSTSALGRPRPAGDPSAVPAP